MVVRPRVADAKADHDLVEEFRAWKRQTEPIEICSRLEDQDVSPGFHRFALQKRLVCTAVGIRHRARERRAMLASAPQGDREPRCGFSERSVEHMRRQAAHIWLPVRTRFILQLISG
jgi:hypothetical protein